MGKKFLIIFILVSVISCINYEEFDQYYVEGQYYEAYQELQKITSKNEPEYFTRRFRVVTRIALDGDSDFIIKLQGLVDDYYESNEKYDVLSNYITFAESFLKFSENDNEEDYQQIISNLTPIDNIPGEFSGFAYKIRGISQYQIGNYYGAIDDLILAYDIDPYIDNYYYIGMSYYGLGKFKKSLEYLKDVTVNSSDDFMKSLAYFQMGEIYYYEEITNNTLNYRNALENYINAINSYSQSATYSYKVAKCLQKLNYETIFPRFLKTSLRIEEEYANAWYLLNIN